MFSVLNYVTEAYGGVYVQIHIFLTSALDGGMVSFTNRPPELPGKEPPVPIGQAVRWTPEHVWTTWRKF
jgi:hypothetical protein